MTIRNLSATGFNHFTLLKWLLDDEILAFTSIIAGIPFPGTTIRSPIF